MQIFAKEWVEYPFNPIALESTAIAKESLFCNAIANAQCERNLGTIYTKQKLKSKWKRSNNKTKMLMDKWQT